VVSGYSVLGRHSKIAVVFACPGIVNSPQ